MKYILALDQGTTSSRAIVFDKKGNPKTYEINISHTDTFSFAVCVIN